jgi:hypothetical protein
MKVQNHYEARAGELDSFINSSLNISLPANIWGDQWKSTMWVSKIEMFPFFMITMIL